MCCTVQYTTLCTSVRKGPVIRWYHGAAYCQGGPGGPWVSGGLSAMGNWGFILVETRFINMQVECKKKEGLISLTSWENNVHSQIIYLPKCTKIIAKTT